ncbi:MAG: serine/threonine-protein kinase [Mariniblastus sp.]
MNDNPNMPTAADGGSALDQNHIPSVEKLMAVFPQLEIQHLIGHGGMGAVYQARQVNLDRVVALKILSPRLASNPAFAERFLREAQTLAKLSHPNIVSVFESGRAGDFYYLVMEFVDGVNLRDTISANLLSADQALAIIPQVCEALQYAHDEGVIHRDIKPENILIAKNGHVRIADFGLAKMLQPSPEQYTLTGTQQVLGTMNYMAPEQIETPGAVDHRADLYSLGVVFYELLTGELPLGRFSLPSEKTNGVSNSLDDLVMRTLEKDPDRRYQQASQIKTACQSVGDHPADHRQEHLATNRIHENPADSAQATSKQKSPPRPLCAPFAVTINEKHGGLHGGLATAAGLLRGYESHLELEFEIRDFLDAVKWGAKTVSIPLERIASIHLYNGMFYRYVEIQCDQMAVTNEIPNSRQGRFRVYIKNASVESAEQLVSGVKDVLGDGAAVEKSGGTSGFSPSFTPQPPVKQSRKGEIDDPDFMANDSEISYVRDLLRIPRIGLCVAGVSMILFAAALIFCVVPDGLFPNRLCYEIQLQFIAFLENVFPFGSRKAMVLMIAVPISMSTLCFISANRIKRLRDYPFILISMFALTLPIHPMFIASLPLAVWVLFVLLQNNTRRVFRAQAVAGYDFHQVSADGNSVDERGIMRAIGIFLFLGTAAFMAFAIMIWFNRAREAPTTDPVIEVSERPSEIPSPPVQPAILPVE